MATHFTGGFNNNPQIREEYIHQNNNVLKRVVLYKFKMYDEDFSPLLVQEAFEMWKTSALGSWCVNNAHDITYHKYRDHVYCTYEIVIIGYMREQDYTWFLLQKDSKSDL